MIIEKKFNTPIETLCEQLPSNDFETLMTHYS